MSGMTFTILSMLLAQDTGQEIAYTSGGQVWVTAVDGGSPRKLAGDLDFDRPLVWSPDGAKLLYWNHAQGRWDIWVVDADGRNARSLTQGQEGENRSPAWSPDGTHIAFLGDGLWVMDADGRNRRALTRRGHRDDFPAWAPDGRTILFVDEGIWRIEPSGRNEERIVRSAWDVTWSPDGKRLLYQAGRAGDYVLAVSGADGRDERILAKGLGSARWSPDGSKIAFEAEQGFFLMDPDGTNRKRLAEFKSKGRSFNPPSWSPDGKRIAFDAQPDKKWALFVVDAAGGLPAKVYEAPDSAYRFFAWRPRKGR